MRVRIFRWVFVILAGFWVGCQPPEIEPRDVVFEAAGGEVKLLSVNLCRAAAEADEEAWKSRREAVFDLLADHGADVVCLQEAADFQVHQICRAFPEYRAAEIPKAGAGAMGPTCPVLYRRDRFEATEEGTFWFSNTPWVAGSSHWDNEFPRSCTWVRLADKVTGQDFFVYNLQLDPASALFREKSTELLVRQIARRKPADPVIVAGDFQDDADSRALQILRGELITPGAEGVKLVDTWLPTGLRVQQEGTYHAFEGRSEGARTDMILTGPQMESVWTEIDRRTFDGQYPSDHFPVATMLRPARD